MHDRVQLDHSAAHSLSMAWPLWIATYVALDYLSFIESYRGLAITPWNPAAGLAVALVTLGGLRYAPVVLLAPVLAGVLVRGGSVPVPVHLIDGLLFGGSYLLAGLLARRYGRLNPRLIGFADAIALLATALLASAMAALSYVLVLSLAGILESREMTEPFVRFFVGDLIGILIVAPAVLLLLTRQRPSVLSWMALPHVVAVAVAFAAIFAIPHAREYQLFYLLFLPLLWWSFRSGIAGAVTALCVIQIGLIVALHIRQGLLADIVSFQMLMISLAATGLVFGSLIDQQRVASLRLRQQQLALGRALRLRSMGEVATAIAHEVNQPITSIRTYAGIAKEAMQAGDAGAAADAVARIRSECDRATAIIRATRDIVRHDGLQPTQVQVEDLLNAVADLLVDRLENVSLRLEIAPDARVLVCDPVQVKQALYNIVDNAIDAIESSGSTGRVTVSVSRVEPSLVEIAVCDTGPGFAPALLNFELTPLVSSKPEGTGIGLSIARSVAEAHGGSLAIESGARETVVKLRLSEIGGPQDAEDSADR